MKRRHTKLAGALVTASAAASMLTMLSLSAAGAAAKPHFACNAGPSVSCHFSTPAANIRCLWTPSPNNVACELLSTRRAYRLGPTGHAKRTSLRLTRNGDTLPTNQIVEFPESLSCHDTRTTITCNQNFGLGAFTLAPSGSHGS